MKSNNISMPIRKFAKKNIVLTVKVKGMTGFRITQWVGINLIKLATKIMGVGVRIEKVHPSQIPTKS